MKSKFIVLALLFSCLTFGLFSEETNIIKPPEQPIPCVSCPTEDPPPCNCGYNCPARIDAKGVWDYFVSATFLYWQPKERGLSIATLYDFTNSGLEKGATVDLEIPFRPALQVGLGFSSDGDGWDILAKYTRFYETISKNKNIPLYSFGDTLGTKYFSPLWFFSNLHPSGDIQSYAFHAKWKLQCNFVDLTMGRSAFTGRWLIIHPFFGLKGGLIDQKVKCLYENRDSLGLYSTSSSNRLHSWLIGPKAGADTNWSLGCGFRFYGNISAALLYQHFKIALDDSIDPLNTLPSFSNFTLHTTKKSLTPNFDLSLGFGWGSYFNDRNWHLDFTIGYDFQIYLDQNLLQSYNFAANNAFDFVSHGLMFHGLKLGAQIDF
jgi:hypothetical protein